MLHSTRRTLWPALVVSVLVHLLLLLSVVGLLPMRLEAPATTINARIRQVKPLADPEQPVSQPVAKALVAPVKPLSPLVHKAIEHKIAVAENGAEMIAAPPSPSSTVGETVAASPISSAALTTAGSGEAASASTKATAREGVSAEELAQFRLSLGAAARRFKRYPSLARERGWEGTVDVALNVNSRLPAPEVVLVHSSGRAVLDEQALQTLAQAARMTSLPEALKGRDFRIPLSLRFDLQEDP